MCELYTLYRSDAPQTSIEAAEALDVTKRDKMVMEAIGAFPSGCISDDDRNYCAQHYNIHSYSSVTARYKSLQEKGLIEILLDTDGNEVKRKGESGRNQRVMVLKERQLELPWSF